MRTERGIGTRNKGHRYQERGKLLVALCLLPTFESSDNWNICEVSKEVHASCHVAVGGTWALDPDPGSNLNRFRVRDVN